MNIIVICGSPHVSGVSASLLRAFLSGLRLAETGLSRPADGTTASGGASGIYLETFSVYDMDISPCADCGVCASDDTCRYRDLDGFDAALRRCSGLVIASPVYHSSFPAPLKALMDRTQRYYMAARHDRPVFRSSSARPAAVLLSAGQKNETGGVIREQLRHILPPMGAYLSEFVVARGTDGCGSSAAALSEAEKAGGRFLSCIRL